MNILLIDDDELLLQLLTHRLQKEGHQVQPAKDAYQALVSLSDHKPDLIISDIMMPYLSGLELLSIINHEYIKPIPFVLISGMEERQLMNLAQTLGAIDYLVKPISAANLQRCIRHSLN